MCRCRRHRADVPSMACARRFRIAGAKALAEGTESFDKVLPDLADRPDMFLDDELAEEIEKKALAKGDREKW